MSETSEGCERVEGTFKELLMNPTVEPYVRDLRMLGDFIKDKTRLEIHLGPLHSAGPPPATTTLVIVGDDRFYRANLDAARGFRIVSFRDGEAFMEAAGGEETLGVLNDERTILVLYHIADPDDVILHVQDDLGLERLRIHSVRQKLGAVYDNVTEYRLPKDSVEHILATQP